ncbi:hypothetical protein GSI_05564 [Ganoderma sinense ZZ0214-1]|uniref:Glycopeptide n=1 Tax=Ganoderma sinense ZZ0214-1 TaxID=1077348 RepID=A0A2G8SFE8_9APHY|nr:hypothetical protein GSI_05564 [Ganoderma sinense ZZ0214-1]
MHLSLTTGALVLAALVCAVVGETHTVHFENFCGSGVPLLIQGQNILSSGPDYTSTGPLDSVIAYLQIDSLCGFNGENCTLIETTLINVAPGNVGSLTDISLIPPHKFSVSTGFYYIDGCGYQGAVCTSANCTAAAAPQSVLCQTDNVSLAITFCAPT